ncbi:MAG: hypothetical protein RI909_2106 [Bacteroidota bacterium]|jgi:6,7-dimethyl-8-ribityllumazine synthase
MAGILKSVSEKSKIDLTKKRFAIVVAEWNEEITEPLFQGAHEALVKLGVKKKDIIRKKCAGQF